MCRFFYLNHDLRRVDIRAGPVNLALDFFLFHGYKPSLGERKLLVSI
jgi:hypothetical protein